MAPLMHGGVIMAVSKDPALSLLLLSIPVLGGAILLVARKGLPLFNAIQVKLDRLTFNLKRSAASGDPPLTAAAMNSAASATPTTTLRPPRSE